MRANVGLVVLAALLSLSSAAFGQGARTDTSARVAVIGQTDSTGLVLADRVRERVAAAMWGGRAVLVPARDIAMTIEQAYRGPEDPISARDIREIGKLVRADIVLALVHDTVRVENVEAIVFPSRSVLSQGRIVGARKLGSWPTGRPRQSSLAIARAFQADSLYRQMVAR
jgi:hypothetical protein